MHERTLTMSELPNAALSLEYVFGWQHACCI